MLFHYKRGSVETYIPWTRPIWEQVIDYFDYIKSNSTIFERYDTYIRGGFLYNIHNTWDLDLNLIGIYEEKQLEIDLNYLLDVSLNKFQLLVDTKWVSKLFEPFTYNNLKNNDYAFNTVSAAQIRNTIKTINNQSIVLDKPNVSIIKELSKNLILLEYKYFHKSKFVDALLKSPNKMLIQSMHANEFLNMSKDDFFKNTNYKLV